MYSSLTYQVSRSLLGRRPVNSRNSIRPNDDSMRPLYGNLNRVFFPGFQLRQFSKRNPQCIYVTIYCKVYFHATVSYSQNGSDRF